MRAITREDFEDAAGFGWTVPPTAFRLERARRQQEQGNRAARRHLPRNVEKAGVEIFMDRAEFDDPHTLQLVKIRPQASRRSIFLVATGGQPSRDTGGSPGTEHCITSNEAFHLEKLPKRIFIAGGGYIAVEFAHIFHGLGAEVTLVYRGAKILRGFDEDMRDALTRIDARSAASASCVDRTFTHIDKRGDELFVFTDKRRNARSRRR